MLLKRRKETKNEQRVEEEGECLCIAELRRMKDVFFEMFVVIKIASREKR